MVSTCAAAASMSAIGFSSLGWTDETPVLGLIFPPSDRGVPEEGIAMYGSNLRFVVTGLGLDRMTPDGYDSVIGLIPHAAERLAAQGAQAIELTGTSLTFYKGKAFNDRLRQVVEDATGLPSITMSDGVIDGLKAVGAYRIAVATAYNDVVNDRLREFLREHGLDPLVVTGLGIEAIGDVTRVTQEDLLEFSVQVCESAPDADSLLVSCGGFRTLDRSSSVPKYLSFRVCHTDSGPGPAWSDWTVPHLATGHCCRNMSNWLQIFLN